MKGSNLENRLSNSLRDKVGRYALQGFTAANLAGLVLLGGEHSVRENLSHLPAMSEYFGDTVAQGIFAAKLYLDATIGSCLLYYGTKGIGRLIEDYQDEGIK